MRRHKTRWNLTREVGSDANAATDIRETEQRMYKKRKMVSFGFVQLHLKGIGIDFHSRQKVDARGRQGQARTLN